MKTQALKTLVMSTFLLVLTAMSVSAQSSNVINIPFDFTIGQKTLPAGEYTVAPNRRDFDNVWLVQSRDSRTCALFTTMTVRANETQETTKLVFHRYGDRYFLSQIWTPGGNGGRELSMAHSERELAKIVAEPLAVVVGAVRK